MHFYYRQHIVCSNNELSCNIRCQKGPLDLDLQNIYIPEEKKLLPNEHLVLDKDTRIYPISFLEVYVQFQFEVKCVVTFILCHNLSDENIHPLFIWFRFWASSWIFEPIWPPRVVGVPLWVGYIYKSHQFALHHVFFIKAEYSISILIVKLYLVQLLQAIKFKNHL